MLVAAFKIKIGRTIQAVVFREHGSMARAGIEPNVENIGLFGEFG